jgi:nucleoside-diphosphate-sugar epimerase
MKILLTGSQGFIGSNLLAKIIKHHDVIAYNHDIRNFHFDQKVDLVIHLAAMTGVRQSQEQPKLYWEVNVGASKTIFNWARQQNVHVLYASSSSAYEWWLNPYAASKKAMEAIAPTNSTGMRFHTVYGPNSRADMFYDQLLKGKVQYLTDHSRDFTHVNDVVDAISCLIAKQYKGIVDIGTGKSVKVMDVANKFGYKDLPIKETTAERIHTCANIETMRSLGWTSKYDILT